MKIFLEHFSVRLPKERARRQYGDRCGRSRSPSRSDGGDPAASSYGAREFDFIQRFHRRFRPFGFESSVFKRVLDRAEIVRRAAHLKTAVGMRKNIVRAGFERGVH